MTVRELIAKLLECDGDALVMVDGYDAGLDDLKVVSQVEVAMNVQLIGDAGAHALISKLSRYDSPAFHKRVAQATKIHAVHLSSGQY